MSVLDIKFLDSDSETIYDYLTALTSSGQVTVKIQNLGDESLTDLGLYLTTTSTLGGDIENPPDYTPSAAYQTLIDWGQIVLQELLLRVALRLLLIVQLTVQNK